MKLFLMILLSFGLLPVLAESVEQGRYLGAKTSETPHWFKDSFLEFEEDVAEAAQQGKRVMIYFHQEGCPYCARLVDENFSNPEIERYIRENFDGISINMWGDKEVISVGGHDYTEKSFAAALKIQYTPTLIFLNEQGKTVLRLNGYYSPEKFKMALQYVADKQESRLSFNEHMLSKSELNSSGKLITEDFFLKRNNLVSVLKNSDKALALYFESSNCAECEILHHRVLSDEPTRALINKMDNVQFDIESDSLITTIKGQQVSQRNYAKQLNIGYTPTVILFDKNGQEVHRIDGFMKTFHFQSSLAYVLESAYLSQPSFQRYISARGDKLRTIGYDTDIWAYDSAYPAD